MPAKGFRLEKDFTTYWLGELGKRGFWKKKWSDASRDIKPYDADIRTNIADYHCEIKIIENDTFGFNQLRPNQIRALEHISSLGGNAVVVIYSIEKNNYVVIDFLELKKKYK